MAKPPPDVVIIDDDEIMRAAIESIVNNAGGNVVGVGNNGKDAVKLYKKHKPDVIFIDYVMPKSGGMEAARKIIKKNPKANVFMVSGYNGSEQIPIDASKTGVRGWIEKGKSGGSSSLGNKVRAVLKTIKSEKARAC